MGGIVAGIAVSYTLSWISAKFLQEDPERPPVDQSTPTTSTRGSPIPRVIGKRRVGPVIGWVGGRRLEEEVEEQGGKGTPSRDVVVGYRYYEQALHFLAVGPVDVLHAIYVGEENILLSDNVTRESYDNGDAIATSRGTAYIYWGDCFDATPSVLSGSIGLGSGFPGACHIVWDEFDLGETTAWPPVEYVVEYYPAECFLGIDERDESGEGRGVNPAAALWELLTADHPLGAHIAPELLDSSSFAAAGSVLIGEAHWLNAVALDITIPELVGRILREIGGELVQYGDQLRLVLRRWYDTAYTIGPDLTSADPPEVVIECRESTSERTIYRYSDAEQNYKQIDLSTADDASAQYRSVRTSTDELHTITDASLVATVADRLGQERAIGAQTFRLRAARNASELMAGMAITWAPIGRARIAAVTHDPATSAVELACVRDVYDVESAPTWGPIPGQGSLSTGQELAPDTAVAIAELPPGMGATVPALVPLRIRSSTSALHGVVTISADGGTSYTPAGHVQNLCVGGTLETALAYDAPYDIAQGPVVAIDSLPEDDAHLLDLIAAPDRWRSGEQLLYIAGEWLYLQRVTMIAAGRYRLAGLIRAREGTHRQHHAAGDRAYIIRRSGLRRVAPRLMPSASLMVKVIPASRGQSLDASAVTPIDHTLANRTICPPPVGDPRATGAAGLRGLFAAGDDLTIAWETRVMTGDGRAADEQTAGTPIADDAPPADGPVVAEILDPSDGSVVRTITAATGAESITYTAAQITADFGSPPDYLGVTIYPTTGGPRGPSRTILASSTGRRAAFITDPHGNFIAAPSGALLTRETTP